MNAYVFGMCVCHISYNFIVSRAKEQCVCVCVYIQEGCEGGGD